MFHVSQEIMGTHEIADLSDR